MARTSRSGTSTRNWTGTEYQAAAHMLAEGLVEEGLVEEGLAVTRAVHDRYDAAKRNPYNEIECSDHYTRAMMSHGVYLAACGYEYHGPKGHLGFAPRFHAGDFRAAFTAAEGWGLYRQRRDGQHGQRQTCTVELRHGRLSLRSLAFEVPPGEAYRVMVRGDDRRLRQIDGYTVRDGRVEIVLRDPLVITAGQSVEVTITCAPCG